MNQVLWGAFTMTGYTRIPSWVPALAVSVFIVITGTILLSPVAIAQEDSPHLTAIEENDGVRLSWTRPDEGGRWAILRSYDEFGLIEDTLAYSSDTTWFDPNGLEYPGRKAFYRIVPWEPDEVPNITIGIEDFDSPALLLPFEDRDNEPEVSLEVGGAFGEPGSHMMLGGDTWKIQMLDDPIQLDEQTIWAIDAMSDPTSRLQMIGLGDGEDEMWYVLWGEYAPNTDSLIWTYQGWYPEEDWFTFNMPVGEDWHGRFGDNPSIDRIFYVNDSSDDDDQGNLHFDNLRDATQAQPNPPVVEFEWQWIEHPDQDSVIVQFQNWSMDFDSDDIRFLWSFGDGSSSVEEHPQHVYPIGGEWPVTLTVADGWNYWDYLTQTLSNGPITQPIGNYSIGFMGDVILARGVQTRINELGQDAIFAGVRDVLAGFDLRITNLECPLTTANTGHPTKGILFRGRPADVTIMRDEGFEFVSLANNHTMDYMEAGLLQTGETLDAVGIAWNGSGMNDIIARQPILMNYNRLQLGIISMSNRDGHYNNYQPFLDAGRNRPGFALWNRAGIESTVGLQDSVDLMMYFVHCGSEYSFIPRDGDEIIPGVEEVEIDDPWVIFSMEPDSGEVALRHYAIEQGADLVICHHPHVIQGVEVYQGKFIAHSLGNFVFDLSYNETMPSMIAKVDIGDDDVEGVSIIPAWIENDLPVIPTGEFARSILDYVTHYSLLLNTHLVRPPDEEIAHVQFDTTYARDEAIGTRQVTLQAHTPQLKRSAPQFLNWEGYVTEVQVADAPVGTRIRYGRDILLWANMEEEGTTGMVTNSAYEGYSTEIAYRGERSLRIQLPEGAWSNYISDFRRRVKLQSEYAHTFLGYIKTRDVSDATFQIRLHESRTQNGHDQFEIGVSGNNDWTPLYRDFDEIDQDWNFLNVRCNQEPPDDNEGTAWFDQLAFIEWQEWRNVDIQGTVDVPFPSGYRYVQIEIPTAVAPPDGNVVMNYKKEWPAFYAPPRELPGSDIDQASR
jgi:poly-gamma-glutamate capsule biosynthesis protein CapA/YwtB (metallophosphatase superfamily)